MTDTATVGDVPSFELHHRLDRALEHAHVKVGEMAGYLDVSPSTMANYLSGRTRPRDGLIRAWALRCGVPYQWIITGEAPDGGSGVPRDANNRTVVRVDFGRVQAGRRAA